MIKKAVILCIMALTSFVYASSYSLQIIQHDEISDKVNPLSYGFEDGIMDYFFNTGNIISNTPAAAVKDVSEDEHIIDKAIMDALNGYCDVMITVILEYSAGDRVSDAAAFSDLQKVDWFIMDLSTEKKIADGSIKNSFTNINDTKLAKKKHQTISFGSGYNIYCEGDNCKNKPEIYSITSKRHLCLFCKPSKIAYKFFNDQIPLNDYLAKNKYKDEIKRRMKELKLYNERIKNDKILALLREFNIAFASDLSNYNKLKEIKTLMSLIKTLSDQLNLTRFCSSLIEYYDYSMFIKFSLYCILSIKLRISL